MTKPPALKPPHLVTLTVGAWSPAQAERFRKQLETMFAATHVAIVDNADPSEFVSIPGTDRLAPVARELPPEAIAAIAEDQAAAGIEAAAPAPDVPPVIVDGVTVAIGGIFRDVHSGAVVRVIGIGADFFTWENTDAGAPDADQIGKCPFSALRYWESVDQGAAPDVPAADPAPDGDEKKK